MLRSLSSGVSGVQAHQTLLDVVGDNISNVNTTGFKKSSVQFTELMSQTLNSATSPAEETGGTNPTQVGLGTSVGGIVVDYTQGNVEYTGGKTDMAVEGDGFFIIENGDTNYYTRAGNFVMDGRGDIVQDGTGFRLQGYKMTDDPINPGEKVTDTVLSDINIPVGRKLPANATQEVGFKCNLDSRVGTVLPMGFNVVDTVASGEIGGTNYSSITFEEGTAISDFLKVTFTDEMGNDVNVDMALQGVNAESGLPVFGDTLVDVDGDGADDWTVHFDEATGQLSVLDASGTNSLWSCELGSAMNYEVVEIGGHSYLAEFNDLGVTGGRQLVVWGDDGTGTMERVSSDLTVRDDGTFDIPTAGSSVTIGGASYTINATSSEMGVSIKNGEQIMKTFDLQSGSIHRTTFEVFDSQGNAHTLSTTFEKVDNNTWRYRLAMPDEPGIDLSNNSGLISFSPDGLVTGVTDLNGSTTSVMEVNFGIEGTEDSTITLDFTGETMGTEAIDAVTQFGSTFTTKEYYQDGYSMGTLQDFSVGSDGVIRGIYDNGQTEELFTVPLAIFANSSGLAKVSGGAYQETANSGSAQVLKPEEGGAGSIAGNSLEASNVDLTEEFVNLIEAQRGFQASARVITTSDQILEELISLKR